MSRNEIKLSGTTYPSMSFSHSPSPPKIRDKKVHLSNRLIRNTIYELSKIFLNTSVDNLSKNLYKIFVL